MTIVNVKGKSMAVASIEGNTIVLTNGSRLAVTKRTLREVQAQMPAEPEPEVKPSRWSQRRKAGK